MSINIPASPDLPVTDWGNIVLTKLFGEGWWDITNRTADTYSGAILPILESLNTIMAFAVIVMALYHVVTSAVGTATSGEAGGSSNSFWWPVRVVFGMGMTAPVAAAGLSAFQVLILSAVGWSMSFANTIWFTEIDRFAESNFSMIHAQDPPLVRREAQAIAELLYNGVIAQQHIAKFKMDMDKARADLGQNPLYDHQPYKVFEANKFVVETIAEEMGETSTVSEWVIKIAAPPGEGLTSDQMGVIRIPGDTPTDPLMIAKVNGIMKMWPIIAAEADALIYNAPSNSNWLGQAISAYLHEVQPIYLNFQEYYPKLELTSKVNKFKTQAKKYGWMSAGAFPLLMSRLSQEAREKTFQSVSLTPPDVGAWMKVFGDDGYNSFESTLIASQKRFNDQPDPISPGRSVREAGLNGDPGIFKEFLNSISGRNMLNAWVRDLEDNPIIMLSEWGHTVVNTSLVMWSAGLASASARSAAKAANTSITGQVLGAFTGNTANMVVGAGLGAASYILNWVEMLIVPLFIFGAILAYVLPAMPLIYWTLAMAAFVLLVVECVVAAPFWAAAHSFSTQSEGLAGELGKRGYFQFLEILFRPPLYVLGFFVIFITYGAIGWLTARLFEAYYGSYMEAEIGSMGLVSSFFFMVIISILFIYLFYFLCTEGYSVLPKKVIRWIGGEGQTLGASAHAEKMRAMIVGGMTGGAGQLAGGSGGDIQAPDKQQPDPKKKDTGSELTPGSVPSRDK